MSSRKEILISARHADGSVTRENPGRRLREVAQRQGRPVFPELNNPDKIVKDDRKT